MPLFLFVRLHLPRIIHVVRRPYQVNRLRAKTSVADQEYSRSAVCVWLQGRFAQLRHGFATSVQPTVNSAGQILYLASQRGAQAIF